jgi:hypothetical protein
VGIPDTTQFVIRMNFGPINSGDKTRESPAYYMLGDAQVIREINGGRCC